MIYFLPRFKNITAMTVSSVRVGVSTVSSNVQSNMVFAPIPAYPYHGIVQSVCSPVGSVWQQRVWRAHSR
jgi:hypothetical protein